jgi:hypothetical protein
MVIETTLGDALVGARATVGTPDAELYAAVRHKMPGANLELIRHNNGCGGVKIILWRYSYDS